MVLTKTNFNLTKYIGRDKLYGELWHILHDEFLRANDSLLKVSGLDFLMQNNPKDRVSIRLREKIIFPLTLIQQYALYKVNELKNGSDGESEFLKDYTHLVIRSSYGIINAGRNSA